jgi:hypothetical protein
LVILESGEHVGEPGARIDIIDLGGLDQRVDGCGAPSPSFDPANVQLWRPTATQG